MNLKEDAKYPPEEYADVTGWNDIGPIVMGPEGSHAWRTDPRRVPIIFARYKFVSKMLAGSDRVLEVGCADGFNMRIVLQTVNAVHGVDLRESFIDWGRRNAARENLSATFAVADVTRTRLSGDFDAAYSMDVIEHIPPEQEATFLGNIVSAVKEGGVMIIGTPNVSAHAHASVWATEQHINLKSAETLRASLQPFCRNVFIFSMNDEVVHTGFYPMAHYLLALCAGAKRPGTERPSGSR
jgi:2-polyprenyl-3-methyl-5-hydroxy-6-metoxy-1,4-benzoquinol methylase